MEVPHSPALEVQRLAKTQADSEVCAEEEREVEREEIKRHGVVLSYNKAILEDE